ncbi:hypothetical protein [Nonomuraea bangladeshensis]|uniref:hypothetical protein n=1 Tax=Nonomuraea bangladeshensis TaxID=404385 RepID=UPI0031E2046B
MSANQIPHFGPKPDDLPGRPRQHSCPDCAFNGGPGHSNRELLKLSRDEFDGNPLASIGQSRRTCGYWSARSRTYCGSTHQVEAHGAIGSRCVNHHPALMDAAYKALTNPVALAV